MLRAPLVGIAIALVACRPSPRAYIGVRGREVSDHLDQLRRDGEAQLATVMVSGKGTTAAEVETVFFYQTVKVGGLTASIETLAAGCPEGDCALGRYRDTAIKLRDVPFEDRKPAKPGNGVATAFGGLALGSLGGMVYCLAECESDKGLKALGLGFGAIVLGLVSYVSAGGTIRD